MGSRKRLTKKQLKQDKFVRTTFELARFVQDHFRKTIIGTVAVVAITGAVLYYLNYRSHKELRAEGLLWNGQVSFESENYPLAITDLEKVREDFAGTKAGPEAMFLLADAYYRSGNLEEAEKVLTGFKDRYGKNSPMSYEAYRLLGCIREDRSAFHEAAEAYLLAAESARFDYQRVKSRLDSARALSSGGNAKQAMEEYQFILDHYPETQETGQVAMRLAELQAAVDNPAVE